MFDNQLPFQTVLLRFHHLFLGIIGGIVVLFSGIGLLVMSFLNSHISAGQIFALNTTAYSGFDVSVFIILQLALPLFILGLLLGGLGYLHWFYTPHSLQAWMDTALTLLTTAHPKIGRRYRTYRLIRVSLPMVQIIHLRIHFDWSKQTFSLTITIPFPPPLPQADQLLTRGFTYHSRQQALILTCQPEELHWRLWQIPRLEEILTTNIS